MDNDDAVILNGSTYWRVTNALLYYQDGLDESKLHTIQVTNLDPDRLTLDSVWFYGSDVVVGK